MRSAKRRRCPARSGFGSAPHRRSRHTLHRVPGAKLWPLLAKDGIDAKTMLAALPSSLRDGKAHLALVVFSIAERVGEAPRQMFWQHSAFTPGVYTAREFRPDLRVVGANRTTHRLRIIQARQNTRTLMLANSQSSDDLRTCANPTSAHRSSEIARNCRETYTRIDRTFGSRLGIARLTVF